MKNEQITIQLSENELSLLHAISVHEKKSESEIVQSALKHYLITFKHQLNCYELASKIGILETAHNLPSDLSTNKNYFDGFGE